MVRRDQIRAAYFFSLVTGIATACVGDDPVTTRTEFVDAGGTGDAHSSADGNPSDLDAASDAPVADTNVPSDATDADSAPAKCDPDQPFTTLAIVATLNSPSIETAVTLTSDERHVIISSNRAIEAGGGSYHLFGGSRAIATDPFGTLTEVFPGETNIHSAASMSPNGLTLFGGSTVFSWVWRTDRGSVDAAFPTPTSIYLQNAKTPHLSADGKTLYVSEFQPSDAGDHFRIVSYDTAFFSLRQTYATLGVGLAPGAGELAPVLSEDELAIYFASYVPSPENWDVYVATRKTKSDSFGVPRRVDELSTTPEDFPQWLSHDNCRLYYLSNREIWLASK